MFRQVRHKRPKNRSTRPKSPVNVDPQLARLRSTGPRQHPSSRHHDSQPSTIRMYLHIQELLCRLHVCVWKQTQNQQISERWQPKNEKMRGFESITSANLGKLSLRYSQLFPKRPMSAATRPPRFDPTGLPNRLRLRPQPSFRHYLSHFRRRYTQPRAPPPIDIGWA